MKSCSQQRSYLPFLLAICTAVSLMFDTLIADGAVAPETDARLGAADIMKLEPPMTLQALIERIGDVSRRGLIGSKDIYTEPMLSRLFGAKTVTINASSNRIGFASGQYMLPYARGDGLNVRGMQTQFTGQWIEYQYGNISANVRFQFSAGGPDRSALETLLGTKLTEIKRRLLRPLPPQPHGRPAPSTSLDGNKKFRVDTQADTSIGVVTVELGSDGKVGVINIDQQTN